MKSGSWTMILTRASYRSAVGFRRYHRMGIHRVAYSLPYRRGRARSLVIAE